jgi:hypothetical protein
MKMGDSGKKLEPVSEKPPLLSKTRALAVSFLKRNYASVPLFGLVALACSVYVGFPLYKMYSANDVWYTRGQTARYQKINLLNPPCRKLYCNQERAPMPELHKLLQEMKEAEK